jgi:NAD(P)-dependent dehydrogenase (short-subunit alcohol dehydrogenase family)
LSAERDGTVWITGAGKGIGRALALKYAAAGYSVAASARTVADLNLLEEDAKPLSGSAHGFRLDTTDQERVSAVLADIERAMGPVDQVILNAGTYIPTPIDKFSPDLVRSLFETNVMGTVHCLSALLKRREDRHGCRVAVVASLAGYRGLPKAAAYGATKAALINMCEGLRPELEPFGITLQLVNPGFVQTPLTDKNDFPMPFLISAEKAAKCIYDGLENNRFQIAFPFHFALIMRVLRVLPDALYFRITRRMVS